MKKADELFKATASTPLALATQNNNAMGYFIPEYQRDYDWSKENIERLYFDILNGFCRLRDSNDASAYTFLGTIILVQQQASEPEFDGVSLEVIDGQQRITTLTLIACVLCELIKHQTERTGFSTLKEKTRKWLEDEIGYWRMAMYSCAVGSQSVDVTSSYPFARIIREGDSRGKTHFNSEYRSSIGKILEEFSKYFKEKKDEFSFEQFDNSESTKKIRDNYTFLRQLIFGLNDKEWYEDTDCELFDIDWLNRSQCIELIKKFRQHYASDSERKKTVNELQTNIQLHGLIRTILFASYFGNCITLTRVITEDESSAFDIFDALNTTGEPLTALETLRPRVIKFERDYKGYKGSDSESAFKEIGDNLEEICKGKGPSKKPMETKEMIVTFALYITGDKLAKDLAQQRLYLRNQFREATSSNRDKRLYVGGFLTSLKKVSTFRRFYWNVSELKNIGSYHGNDIVESVKLQMRFLIAMGNSLALPILARYWSSELDRDNDVQFENVLRALVAFVVLRRAATGSTAGIDSDLRGVMSGFTSGDARKLCRGIKEENELISVSELRVLFKDRLERKLQTFDKSSWVDKVCANPLYRQSRELVRFMVFAAAHNAKPSKKSPGLWDRSSHVPSVDHANLLTFNTWEDDRYGTVEHVAPSRYSDEWPMELYTDEILRHSLGNLILLPKLENSILGASNWDKKKQLYLALAESDVGQLKKIIAQAEQSGFSFPVRLREKLEKGNRLSILDSMRDVDEWDLDLVVRRGKNIAELCWDVVRPWLDD